MICKKTRTILILCQSSVRIMPYCNHSFSIFFPPQRLSAQLHESMTESQKDELFSKMLTTVEMTDQDICFTTFLVPDYRNDLPTIQQMGLADSTFICDRRKGFSQITPGTKFRNTEHKLTALSRRFWLLVVCAL